MRKLKDSVNKETYQAIIKLYKNLLKRGDKDMLFFFKAIIYCALNQTEENYWMPPAPFLMYLAKQSPYNKHYPNFETFYKEYKKGGKQMWFGVEIKEANKIIL